MKRVVDFAHQFILDYLNSNAVCIDFTMGHGYDTLFLSKHCPEGKVYAFDISKEAIDYTTQQLENANIKNVELILDGHENFDHYVQHFKVGIFNFGFLPHSTTYQPTILNTSKTAVEKALKYLQVKGLLILVCYPGHPQGKEESDHFSNFVSELDPYYYSVFEFKMKNAKLSPYILGIEKKRENS